MELIIKLCRLSGVLEPVHTVSWEPVVQSLPNFVFSDETDSLKSATLGVFTQWKLANVTDLTCPLFPRGIVKHLLTCHWLWLSEKEHFIFSRWFFGSMEIIKLFHFLHTMNRIRSSLLAHQEMLSASLFLEYWTGQEFCVFVLVLSLTSELTLEKPLRFSEPWSSLL